MIHRRSGFTLIELMLAISIAVLLMMLAIPSIRGLSAQQKLDASFERFDTLARKAQLNAVSQQRAWTLTWEANAIVLQPDEPTPEERFANTASERGDTQGQNMGVGPVAPQFPDPNGSGSSTESIPVDKGQTYILQRPVALLPSKDVPTEWTFWRSGTCEPVIVTYTGPEGTWTAQYHPLTGHGEITDQRLP